MLSPVGRKQTFIRIMISRTPPQSTSSERNSNVLIPEEVEEIMSDDGAVGGVREAAPPTYDESQRANETRTLTFDEPHIRPNPNLTFGRDDDDSRRNTENNGRLLFNEPNARSTSNVTFRRGHTRSQTREQSHQSLEQEHSRFMHELNEILSRGNNTRNSRSFQEPRDEFKSFLKALFVFNGSATDLQRFLFIGDCARDACTNPEDEKVLVKQMLVHLDGATYSKVALYKNYTTYEALRADLVRLCGTVRTVAQVQDDITRLYQGSMSLIEYGSRATQLLSELLLAAHSQYGQNVAEVNRGIYEETVIRAYVKGLPENLRILVASGRHEELRCAIGTAEAFLDEGFVNPSRTQFGQREYRNNFSNNASNTRFGANYFARNRNFNDYRPRTNFSANNFASNQPRTFNANNNFNNNYQSRPNFSSNNNQSRSNFNYQTRPSTTTPPTTVSYDRRASFNRQQPFSRSYPSNNSNNFRRDERRVDFDMNAGRRINTLHGNNPDRYYVRILTDLRDTPLVLLLDTGSDVTILSPGIYCGKLNQGKIDSVSYGNNKLKISGFVIANIIEAEGFIPHQFLVANEEGLPGNGILGLDFLRVVSAVIDAGRKTLTFANDGKTITWKLLDETDLLIDEIFNQVFIDHEIGSIHELSTCQPSSIEAVAGSSCADEEIIYTNDDEDSDFEEETWASALVPTFDADFIDNLASLPYSLENFFDTEFTPEKEVYSEDNEVNELLHEFNDVLYKPNTKLTATTEYEADIQLVKEVDKESGLLIEARPVFTKPYPIPNKYFMEVYKQIDQMEADEIIRRAESPVEWNSPVHMVPKKAKKGWNKTVSTRN